MGYTPKSSPTLFSSPSPSPLPLLPFLPRKEGEERKERGVEEEGRSGGGLGVERACQPSFGSCPRVNRSEEGFK